MRGMFSVIEFFNLPSFRFIVPTIRGKNTTDFSRMQCKIEIFFIFFQEGLSPDREAPRLPINPLLFGEIFDDEEKQGEDSRSQGKTQEKTAQDCQDD